jgi:hypothetical protein
MSRVHGRRGRVYIDTSVGGSGQAIPLPFAAAWSITFATDKQEVTALEDNNKIYVAGLPDASGDWSGFYDDQSVQSYNMAVDGIARRFYLYPSLLVPTTYFWGTILGDFKTQAAVGGATEMSASWNAASTVQKQGVLT